MSTTVDEELLRSAREMIGAETDAALIDEALRSLVEQRRATEIDASYAAYDEHPLSEPDAWGDLESFCVAVSETRPET